MKKKGGLGGLLLQGFLKQHQRQSSASKKPRVKTSLKKRSAAFKVSVDTSLSIKNKSSSLKKTKGLRRASSFKPLSLSKMQGWQPKQVEEALPVVAAATETVPLKETLQEMEVLSTPPAQVQEVQVVPAAAPSGSSDDAFARSTSLSTEDLVRPDDRLRQSIEAFLLDQRSPHTRRAYGKDLKRFVQFLLTRKFDQGVENISRILIITYKDSLISEQLEHTTVDRHLATLRSFFKWLVEDGLIAKSPADGVRFLNPKRVSRTNGFSDEEVRKILTLPDLHTRVGAMHYAVLMVLFYCGLRRSELCDLRTTYVGLERNQRVLRLRGKGNAERVIVMVPPVWNAVRYYLHIVRRDLSTDEFLFSPLRNNRTGVVKKALDPSTIFYIVTKYAKLGGIANRVSPHSCRATAISNARDHKVPDRAIQEFAGWASPDMITRYDKRKSAVIDSAAHSITYGASDRSASIPSTLAAPNINPTATESSEQRSKTSQVENKP